MAKILWLDDNKVTPAYDELVSDGLEVTAVTNPSQLWDELQAAHPQFDLIILDIIAPPGDTYGLDETKGGLTTGLLVLEHLRQSPALASIPVLIFTIRHEDDVNEYGHKYGVTVLRKQDTRPAELLKHVKAILAK